MTKKNRNKRAYFAEGKHKAGVNPAQGPDTPWKGGATPIPAGPKQLDAEVNKNTEVNKNAEPEKVTKSDDVEQPKVVEEKDVVKEVDIEMKRAKHPLEMAFVF